MSDCWNVSMWRSSTGDLKAWSGTGVEVKDEIGSRIHKACIQQCFKCGWEERGRFTQSGVFTALYLTSASIKKDRNWGKKDIWLIDNVKEILTASWNSLKVLAEKSKICAMNTNYSSFPPQPARRASVLSTRRTSLSSCLTDRASGAVAASAPTKKNVVAQTTAVTSLPTLHAARVCSRPGHQLLGCSFPLGGATGRWEDF